MTADKTSKNVPIDLSDDDIDQVHGGSKVTAVSMDAITRKSKTLKSAESKDTASAGPVFNLGEDFAP